MFRRACLCALAVATAAALALWLVRNERDVGVDVGGDADAAAINGFHAPERAWRTTGRWTTGDATVTVKRGGLFATALRVRFCTHPARNEEHLRISAGVFDVHNVRVPAGCQQVERPIQRHPGDADITVRIASSPVSTPQDARPLGVFVDRVEIVNDGPGLSLRRAMRPLALTAALLAGVLVAGWMAGRLAAPAWTLASMPVAGLALSMASGAMAAVIVRTSVPTADAFARGACWALLGAAVLAFAASRGTSRAMSTLFEPRAAARPARVWAFAAVAVAALAVLLREAVLDGRVLSQANLLFQIFPWRTHLPEGYAPGNRLLGDIPLVFYPFLFHVRSALSSGSLPLWNPLVFTGQPIFACFQSAILSPFTILAALTPLPMGTVVGAASRLLTGGIGFFLFARVLGLSAAACYFCGLAYALNAFSLVWLEHPLSAVAAWLPWLLWSIERLARRARGRDAALLAGAVALTILAGHPETAFKVLAFGGVYALVVACASEHRLRVLSWLAVAGAIGLLLCAVQVLPFLEYLRESRVFAERQTFTVNPYFVSPETLITAIVPDFWGNPAADSYVARANRLGIPTNYCEQQAYAGVVTWMLAAVGLAAARWDVRRAFFAASALMAAALMYNVPAAMAHVTALPLLRITVVSRFGLIVIACAIVLAGYGVDALTSARDAGEGRAHGRRLMRGALAAAVAIAAAAVWGLARFNADLAAAGLASMAPIGVAFAVSSAIVTAALIAARARHAIVASAFGVAVCVLGAGELVAFGQHFRAFVPPADVAPRLPEIEAIRSDPGLFRVIGFGAALPPNAGMPYGLQDPRGYDGMSPRRVSELLDVALSLQGSFHMTQHVEGSHILDLLNVKYIVGRPGLELPAPQFVRIDAAGTPVFRNTHALPRVLVADAVRVAEGNAARRLLRDATVDPRRTVVLEAPLPPESAPQPAAAGEADAAHVRHYRDSFVEVETRTAGRRLLVLTDLWYPGWRATIDGRESPIVRANFAFRAVSVPAGHHVVQFAYQPASVRLGAAITLAALVLTLALAAPWSLRPPGAWHRRRSRS